MATTKYANAGQRGSGRGSGSGSGSGNSGSGTGAEDGASAIAVAVEGGDAGEAASPRERERLQRLIAVATRIRSQLAAISDDDVAECCLDHDSEESDWEDEVDGCSSMDDEGALGDSDGSMLGGGNVGAESAGAGASMAADKLAAELAMTHVRFLTAGQHSWDWFQHRRGHITASMAPLFRTFASDIGACQTASMLQFVMDNASRCAADAWRDSADSSLPARANAQLHRNRATIACLLKRDSYVRSLFDAGLAESKEHPWLATSPDGIGAVGIDDLTDHLSRNFGSVVAPLEADTHLPFKFKMLAPSRSAEYGELVKAMGTARKWMACAVDSDDFKLFVPCRSDRLELIHSMATFSLPALVYVVASDSTDNPIIAKILVVPTAWRIKQHVDTLGVLAEELMAWMYDGPEARAPRWMRTDMAQLLESQQQLWWTTRMAVLQQGPMHPVESLEVALVAMYNECVARSVP